MRVAYVCCAFDDHHVGVGEQGMRGAVAAANGCVVQWSAGVLTRTCESAARYAWDNALAAPSKATGSLARGCEQEHEKRSRLTVSGWASGAWPRGGTQACINLERHGAAAVCTQPAPSYGYDVGWHGNLTAPNALTVEILGSGDSTAALLAATHGRCRGEQVRRTLAAFHAALSKRLPTTHALPPPNVSVELHPRWLARRS
mmetsp:Transcript_12972/g.26103  ORF Transcript_12972/g.26103 Transcript_12972/m.26103 type:complete len:201 (-) Transcript_12972:122-724(-)